MTTYEIDVEATLSVLLSEMMTELDVPPTPENIAVVVRALLRVAATGAERCGMSVQDFMEEARVAMTVAYIGDDVVADLVSASLRPTGAKA